MITVADTLWESASLFGVFIFGLLLVPVLSRQFALSAVYAFLLYVWHSIFCVVYIVYSLSNTADAKNYFIWSFRWEGLPELGTQVVIFFTSILTQNLSLSYGGVFFVNNIIGFAGLVAFAACLSQIATHKTVFWQRVATLLPFLPSFSFWSTAIGKDSLAFFAVCLVCWAAFDPYRRLATIGFAVCVLLLVRPHVAGFLVIALGVAFTFASDTSFLRRVSFSAILVAASVGVAITSLQYVGFDDGVSVDRLSDYIEKRQGYNLQGGSSVDIANAPVAERLFIYMFRPLFFDARNALSLIVSVENALLLTLFLVVCSRLRLATCNLSSFQVYLMVAYCLFAWIVLANTTANLGIAIRQKTMITPMLCVLLFSFLPSRDVVADRGKVPIYGL